MLPLQNLSPDAGQDYLADGITEELTTSLAETLPLRVISRTSVMPYKQTNKSIRQIARELGVDAIVEGSVARSGNQVSVTVQLIDPGVDRHLWAAKVRTSSGRSLGHGIGGCASHRATGEQYAEPRATPTGDRPLRRSRGL